MSEYQYYYFESVDAPLTDAQQQELRKISSRAEICSRHFVNEYEYGDLKADPRKLLAKYFDVHLYYANWGTRTIMFRIPLEEIDFSLAAQYATDETLAVKKAGKYAIFEFTVENTDDDDWWEIVDEIGRFAALRDDLRQGDYRCLFLAWLAQFCYDADGGEPELPRKMPPVPGGLQKPPALLKKFAEFMYVCPELLKKTLKHAIPRAAAVTRKTAVQKNDPEREERIAMEVVVDAYDPEERALGWYYYLEEALSPGMKLRCFRTRSMSPLKRGEQVVLLRMAPEADCMSEMFVYVKWKDRRLAVPLSQLEPQSGSENAREAVYDWLYWCRMGYTFH